jgi:hypothetical protein
MFWEYGRNDIAYKYPKAPHRSPNLAVRSGEWKLLMNSDGSDVQLYNIMKDRNETTNVSKENAGIAEQLKSELSSWWKSLPRLEHF